MSSFKLTIPLLRKKRFLGLEITDDLIKGEYKKHEILISRIQGTNWFKVNVTPTEETGGITLNFETLRDSMEEVLESVVLKFE